MTDRDQYQRPDPRYRGIQVTDGDGQEGLLVYDAEEADYVFSTEWVPVDP